MFLLTLSEKCGLGISSTKDLRYGVTCMGEQYSEVMGTSLSSFSSVVLDESARTEKINYISHMIDPRKGKFCIQPQSIKLNILKKFLVCSYHIELQLSKKIHPRC
jgi:hypothetical protein